MTMRTWRLWFWGLAALLLAPHAQADIGVPMVFITVPGMVLALIPIVVVETFVMVRMLRTKLSATTGWVVTANLVSTLVGIPLTWGALLGLQILSKGTYAYGLGSPLQRFLAVTWQAPWLIPYENDICWMMPVASLVLLVPFFFASAWVENKVISWFKRTPPKDQVKAAVWKANMASYALLALINVGWLAWSLMHPPAMLFRVIPT